MPANLATNKADATALATDHPGHHNSLATYVNLVTRTIYYVEDYGAVGDGVEHTDGAMASGSTTLTSTAGTFTNADVGKTILVNKAAASGQALVTTISAFVSATQVTLSAANASGGAVSSAVYCYGTDDTAALQSAIDAAIAAPGDAVVELDSTKVYCLTSAPRTDRSGNSILSLTDTSASSKRLSIRGSGGLLANWNAEVATLYCLRASDTYKSSTTTTLNGAFNAGATSCTLTSAASFPNAGFAVVDNEIFSWTSKTGNTLNGVTKNKFGSGDSSHTTGTTVFLTLGTPSVLGAATIENGGVALNWIGTVGLSNFKIKLPNDPWNAGIDAVTFGGIDLEGIVVVAGSGTDATALQTHPWAFGLQCPTSFGFGILEIRKMKVMQMYAGFISYTTDHLHFDQAEAYQGVLTLGFLDGGNTSQHPITQGYLLNDHTTYTLAGWDPVNGPQSLSIGSPVISDLVVDVENLGGVFAPDSTSGVVLDANNKLQGKIRVHYFTGLGIGTTPPINGAQNLQIYNLYAGPTTGGLNVIASASTITVPPGGDSYQITGTTTINTINPSWLGRTIKLRFATANCAVGNGTGNIKLQQAFTAQVDDALHLVYAGTPGWIEVGRKMTTTNVLGTVYTPDGMWVAQPASSTATANTIYGAPVRIVAPTTLTGIRYRVGATATGNVQVGLYNKAASSLLASSASAAVATASTVQSVNFSATVTVEPGIYWPILQFSAAATFMGTGAANYLGNSIQTAQGSFTLPSSFTPQSDTTQATGTVPALEVF